MQSIKCQNCGSKVDFELSNLVKDLVVMEENHVKEFEMIRKVLGGISERIYGNTIGFVQETVTIADLKSGCPYDKFSEECSSKHGTDIVAFVREGVWEIGKISISVKRHKKWDSVFLEQLSSNIDEDRSQWGLLVTTAFPCEALNNDIWTTFDGNGRLLLMVKPRFVRVAYYAIRQIILYQHSLRHALIRNEFVNTLNEKLPLIFNDLRKRGE